jgi:hypothetical protein
MPIWEKKSNQYFDSIRIDLLMGIPQFKIAIKTQYDLRIAISNYNSCHELFARAYCLNVYLIK